MSNIIQGHWQDAPKHPNLSEFAPFSPAECWEGKRAPFLDWMVEGAFLRGTVAILAGDGGLGKSLLLQQLMTAAAIDRPWLGMRTTPCRSLAVFCEDDVDELHRRQEAINEHYGCKMSELSSVRMESRPGRDCVLMEFPRWGGDGRVTPMYHQVWQAAEAHKANVVILDTVADVYSGNEVDRNQPRTFIRWLRRLAIKIQGVVILTQHPSLEGMNSGSGRSGSTGWHNSVRSRLYLTLPKKRGEDEEPTNERRLKVMKNNAGKFGGWISVTWERGVFRLTEQETPRPYWQD